jgi:hypothetical protein
MRRALLFALLVAAGCTKARTEAVIVVTTDGVRIPDDVDQILLKVADTADAANPLFLKTFRLCGGSVSGDCLGLPLDFTLIPGKGHPGDSTRVQLTAQRGSTALIDDAAIFTFAPGESLRLDFVLYANCLGNTDCAVRDQACGPDDKCQPITPTHIQGEPDLATPPPQDLAVPVDMTLGPDLSVGDMALGPDMTLGRDMRPPPDLTPPPDMAGCTPFVCGPNYTCGPDPTGCSTDPVYCGTCSVGTEYCYQMAGFAQCNPCGQTQGQICCPPSSTCSGANLYCNTGTCQPCGAMAGQVCCPGNMCNSGLHCMTGMCVPDSDGGAPSDGGTGPDQVLTWTASNSYDTGTLYGVWGTGSNVYAVGDQGGTTRSIFMNISGGGMPLMFSPDPRYTAGGTLRRVWGTSTTNVYVIGFGNTVLKLNGGTWTNMSAGLPGGNGQNGLWAGGPNSDDVWVAGGNPAGSCNDAWDYAHYNGTTATWGSGATGPQSGSGSCSNAGLWGDGAGFVVMVSNETLGRYTTTNAINAMTTFSMGASSHYLYSVFGLSKTQMWTVGDAGTMFNLNYNGSTVVTTVETSGVGSNLYGVGGSKVPSISLWAVGDSGVVLHSVGDGIWTKQTNLPALATGAQLNGVFAFGANDVYVVGSSGGMKLIMHGK